MERTSVPPVVVVQHSPNVPPGLLEQFFEAKGIPWRVVAIFKGETLPAEGEYSAIVSLGGIMGAYDEEEYPWLVDEKRWLKSNALNNVPILGICLGCQLLADALGGRAYPTPSGHELGFPDIQLLPEGAADPILSKVPSSNSIVKYVLCHGDTWDLPPGATLLASSERCRQAFRINSAWGVQFHPEATAPVFEDWLKSVRASYVKRDKTPPLSDEQEAALNRLTQLTQSDLKIRADALFTAWISTIPVLQHFVQ